MAVVSSFGALQRVGETRPSWSWSGGSVRLDASTTETYAKIYRTQPNVRTCVDFIARNIAQLGLHVYRVVSDTDRERLRDHELASWLKTPSPASTRYRLIENTIQDYCIYLNAYWLKVRLPNRIGIQRLPPEQMRVEGGLIPTQFVWTNVDGEEKFFAPSEIVHFSGYDPCNPLMGLSPMETLRRVLAEEKAASDHRQYLWQNAARIEGVIEQTADAPGAGYSPDQAKKWREQWQEAHAAKENAGKTAMLGKGMKFQPTSFSSKDSEYVNARKLNREEVAAAFHIPLPMVGILEHATFSNIREQHKHLYQDCLGPTLVMVEEEIERQLLVECRDQRGVYVEFNIAEKLKGSFEEQAAAIVSLTGRPVMSGNEGRARLNLPRMTQADMDTVALPMNMDGNAEDETALLDAAPESARDA